MHTLLPFIRFVSSPLVAAIDGLAPAVAEAGNHPLNQGDVTVAAFAVSSGVIAFACTYWACWLHARLGNLKRQIRLEKAQNEAQSAFREALLSSGPQGLVVMKSPDEDRQYFGEGKSLFELVMDSPDAPQAIRALDRLTEEGESFAFLARSSVGPLALRGTPVGRRAVLYICEQNIGDDSRRYQEMLEQLALPAWLRDQTQALTWANRAFLDMTGMDKLSDAVAANVSLDWAERDIAAAAFAAGKPAQGQADAFVGGKPRTLSLHMTGLPDGAVAGVGFDLTPADAARARLQQAFEAQADLVNHLPEGVAVLRRDLTFAQHNSAFALLWGLSADWLESGPAFGDILDQLRDKRRLPEQRNFADWKQSLLQRCAGLTQACEETWHLPGGKSIRLMFQPHLEGGVFILCQDISEQLRLETSLNLLTQVQKATLDTLDEGIAIFGTDGRLALHNALFAQMWQLTENELVEQPHFAEIANLCTQRIGRDGIWGIVACGVNSATPERFGEWGKARRADGKLISLALSRLPNGATVATFSDITDLDNFSSLQGAPMQNATPYVAA